LARVVGVIFSPRETYAAVAARPRWFGVLSVSVLIIGAATAGLMFTDVGKQLALDQNVAAMEAFGQTVTDEMYAGMERGMAYAPYTGAAGVIVFVPISLLISGGILHVLFGLVGGGTGTFRQVYAVVAHSTVITALQQTFTTALTIASGKRAGANLGIFAPTLEETSFLLKLMESVDFFLIWSTFSTAIGLAVLYKRRTGPIATTLFGIYLVIALVVAYFRSGS
jgi:hypothetical protein